MKQDITGNQALWLAFGIPATLSWIVIGAAWLLAPRLGLEPNYILYGLYTIGGWYRFLAIFVGGPFALFALISIIAS